MSYTVEVSNVTGKNRNFPLRRLDAKGNGYTQDFKIPAYALNHKLNFASEDEYKKWVSNYEAYVSGKNAIIKVGKSNGNALEKQNKDVEKEEAKKAQACGSFQISPFSSFFTAKEELTIDICRA